MTQERLQSAAVSVLRIAIGWHFLYEGLVKLTNPGWSAEGFLSGANWIFSSTFHKLAENPEWLSVLDFLNIWGLIFIGAGLLLGIWIRPASVAGILLLLLYYSVNPALIGVKFSSITSEGSYLIVNKNIIEALALLVVLFYPLNKQVGLQLLLIHYRNQRASDRKKEAGVISTSSDYLENRRSILQNLLVLPVAALFGYAFMKKKSITKVDAYTGATTSIVPDKSVGDLTKDDLFLGKIGNQNLSRLILGGGCFTGWQHARDLRYVDELASAYNTEQRVINTLKLIDEVGINMVNIYTQQLHLVQRFSEIYDNDLSLMVAVGINKDNYHSETDIALEAGASLVYIQPAVSDRLVYYNEPEVIEKALNYIRKAGLPAGIGCYSVNTVEKCEHLGIVPDFYVKSIHPDNYWSANPAEHRQDFEPAFHRFYSEHHRFHDNIFDLFPKRTMEVMSRISVPWIGFKTLASGAVSPEEGFRFAFEAGADFISAGMFDFHIERNIKTAISAIQSVGQRERKWFG
jgi:uncharacterized membrane protein YphA (DoxX/SURF4 family)